MAAELNSERPTSRYLKTAPDQHPLVISLDQLPLMRPPPQHPLVIPPDYLPPMLQSSRSASPDCRSRRLLSRSPSPSFTSQPASPGDFSRSLLPGHHSHPTSPGGQPSQQSILSPPRHSAALDPLADCDSLINEVPTALCERSFHPALSCQAELERTLVTPPNVELNPSGDIRRPEPRQPVAIHCGKYATLSFMPIWSALLQRSSTLCNEVFERIRRVEGLTLCRRLS
jgi:hypothetical protein